MYNIERERNKTKSIPQDNPEHIQSKPLFHTLQSSLTQKRHVILL